MVLQRRSVLAGGAAGVAGTLAGCASRLGGLIGDDAGNTVATIEVESSVSVAVFRWGIQEGVWADQDIDLDFGVEPFGQYNRQLVAELADIGAPSTVAQLEFMAEGESLRFVGHQQNMFNRMFAAADDDSIDDPSDLGGKRLGMPAALSSTTSTVHRALVLDEYDFDLFEDTAETRAADPPVLWELLLDGELDAISEFSGFTIRGIADDAVKTIFDPYELWQSRTGNPIPTTTFTVRSPWLDEHRSTVERFLAGWEAALSSFRANTTDALDEFGTEAGITDPAEADVIDTLMDDEVIFGQVYYDADLIDAHWEFFELLTDSADLTLPDRAETFVTQDELASG